MCNCYLKTQFLHFLALLGIGCKGNAKMIAVSLTLVPIFFSWNSPVLRDLEHYLSLMKIRIGTKNC